MGNHARLSPSSASRWMACPGSPDASAAAIEMMGGEKQNPAAMEGTLAHELAEKILKRKTFDASACDEDMLEHVYGYVAYVRRAMACAVQPVRKMYGTEMKLNLSNWIPESFGTADFWAVRKPDDEVPETYLHVVDLKYGIWHRVDAENNPQLRAYALGVLDALPAGCSVPRVRMTIYQPRAAEPIVRSEDMTTEDLLQWGRDVLIPAGNAAAEPFAAQGSG